MQVLRRILLSQKQINTAIGSLVLTFGASQGLADVVVQGIAALFAVLVVVQGALDYKHGSPSDQTGDFRG